MMFLTNCGGRPGATAARDVLSSGGAAIDAVEKGIQQVESDLGIDSVGLGGSPDLLGHMSCDAAIMDGATLCAGAVGELRGYLHAISVARKVTQQLPHVMLVADGACRFAREVGAETADLLTKEAAHRHRVWLEKHVPRDVTRRLSDAPLAEYAWVSGQDLLAKGTVILLARDRDANIAAGTSTSGWAYRYPGRLGDSAVIGAGVYADNQYGACGCTHIGEMSIRCGTARSVVLYMKKGASVRDACVEAVRDLRDLKGGFLGPLVIHAIDRDGGACVVSLDDRGEKMSYYLWRDGMAEPERRVAEVAR